MYLHLLHPLLHISILTLPLPTFSLPNPITSPQSTPHTVSTLHEFSPGTWVENLAVRSTNNHILTTFVSAPQVVQLSPSSPIPPQTIATFPGYTSTLGIIEAERDIFYVVAGNFSLKTFTPTIGSWSVFRLDFRDCDPQSHHPNNNNNNNNNPSSAAKNSAPKITKIADFPTAGLLNGLAILPSPSPSSHPHPNHPNPPYKILIADSNLGAIYTLNPHPPHQITHTLTHPLLSPNASATPRIGINGLHSRFLGLGEGEGKGDKW
ncbi:MAG: hypothetical protein LQ350_000667 [Teloschistes chrysophthalmus]|nr:MAG: hypothetical protein LQ350_000667 [Niorma chrysophthalma]